MSHGGAADAFAFNTNGDATNPAVSLYYCAEAPGRSGRTRRRPVQDADIVVLAQGVEP